MNRAKSTFYSLVLSLTIVFSILFFAQYWGKTNSNNSEGEIEEDENVKTQYRMIYTQDDFYIYDIQVTEAFNPYNENGPIQLWELDELCLTIYFDAPYLRESTYEQRENNFGLPITDCKHEIVEYESPMNISFEYITKHNSSQPFLDQEYANLTMSVQFFDNDMDTRLSKGDNLLLTVINDDNGEYYYLSNFRVKIEAYWVGLVAELAIEYIPFSSDEDDYIDGIVEGKELE